MTLEPVKVTAEKMGLTPAILKVFDDFEEIRQTYSKMFSESDTSRLVINAVAFFAKLEKLVKDALKEFGTSPAVAKTLVDSIDYHFNIVRALVQAKEGVAALTIFQNSKGFEGYGQMTKPLEAFIRLQALASVGAGFEATTVFLMLSAEKLGQLSATMEIIKKLVSGFAQIKESERQKLEGYVA